MPEVTELDLANEGISTVLWTTGYAPDYDWLDIPIERQFGVPVHDRGVTEMRGLDPHRAALAARQRLGKPRWVARDAEYLASRWEDGV